MTIRKQIGAMMIGILFCFLMPAPGGTQEAKETLSSMTVVADDNYPPYIFRDAKGDIQGILVDMWKLWEKKTGVKVTLVAMDWDKAQTYMLKGHADVIDTIFYNEERARLYDFTKPYAKLDVPVFFHKNLGGLVDIASLQGFTIGVKSGDACIDVLKRHGISSLKEYSSYEAIVKAAANHQIKVFSIDKPPALYYLYKMNLEGDFRYSLNLYTGEFHRAVKKGRTDLLKTVEDGFSLITKSEQEAIEKKWQGESFSKPLEWRKALFAVMVIVILLLALIFLNLTLQRRVRVKTSELQQLVDQLKRSEEKYRELIEYANSIILRRDRAGKVTYFNEFAQQFFGYAEEEIRGRNVIGTIVPETESTGRDLRAMIEEISQYPELYVNNVNENMLRNGERVWIAWTNKPVYDENDHLIELLCIGNDITERKRTEEALARNEHFLRLITDNIQDAIRVVDLQSLTYTYANPYNSKLFGIPAEDLIGMALGAKLADAEKENLFRIFEDELAHDAERDPYRFRMFELQETHALTGETIWTENKASFIRDSAGKPVSVLSITRDVTEKRRAEKILRESERLYRALLETTNTGYTIIDGQGIVLDANDEYVRLTGHGDLKDILGRSVVEWTAEFEREKNTAAILECLANGYIRNLEIHYQDAQGNVTPVEINATLVEKEGVQQILSLCRDITNRKKIEAERQRLEERLRRAEKMEAVGTLAGGVAHDLNNVIGVLVGYSELLLERIAEESPLRKYVNNILQSGLRGAAIIQDLLTLARRGVPVSEVMNLNDIITEYFKTPEFEKLRDFHPQATFRVDLQKDLLNIKGSPVHLGKTVMNLTSNAVESLPDRGEVWIRTENRYLDGPVKGYEDVEEGNYVVLTIADSGKGISADDIGKIFEPFYTRKVMGRSGTGLGLTVVWGTVRDHRGYIDVESEEGKGTVFTIYLPVTADELLGARQSLPAEAYQGQGESILVVDDVKEQRELAMTMLKRLGYDAEAVSSGEEAVTYLKTKTRDLLILDMIMDPGIDGLETFRQIREMNPRQKAIIVSGFSETDRVKKVEALGAGPYVRKPYVMETIGLAIRQALSRPPEGGANGGNGATP